MAFDFRCVAAEEFWLHLAAVDGVLDGVVGVVVEDDDLATFDAAFHVHAGKETGEAVVIIQRPTIERMVVALSTLNARAEEDLSEVLGRLLRREPFVGGVEVRRRLLDVAAVADDQFRNELIERPIRGHLVVNPRGVGPHRLLIAAVLRLIVDSSDAEQLAPLHRPQVDELFAVEQRVDQLHTFVFDSVGDEAIVFFTRRREADQVERDAPQERFVVADLGRSHVQLLELVEDERVDEVRFRNVLPSEVVIGRQNDDLAADGELVEPSEHERPAPIVGLRDAVFVDAGDCVVVREEQRQSSDIAHRAVRVSRHHDGLLRLILAGEHGLRRQQFDAERFRRVAAVIRCPRFDPAEHRAIVVAVGREELPAGVINFTGGFLQQQALLRHREIDSPTDQLPRQLEVVPRRVVPEQRQMKPILALRRSVTTSGIATALHEDRHDVQSKADIARDLRVLHDHRHLDLVLPQLDQQLRLAIGHRLERLPRHLDDLCIRHLHDDVA